MASGRPSAQPLAGYANASTQYTANRPSPTPNSHSSRTPNPDSYAQDPFRKFPPELMMEVFDYLPPAMVYRARLVCKDWNVALRQPQILLSKLIASAKGNDTDSTVGYLEAVGGTVEDRERRYKNIYAGRPVAYTHIPYQWPRRCQQYDHLPAFAQLKGHYLGFLDWPNVTIHNLVTGRNSRLFRKLNHNIEAFCLTDSLLAVLAFDREKQNFSILVVELANLFATPRLLPVEGKIQKMFANKHNVGWTVMQHPKDGARVWLYDHKHTKLSCMYRDGVTSVALPTDYVLSQRDPRDLTSRDDDFHYPDPTFPADSDYAVSDASDKDSNHGYQVVFGPHRRIELDHQRRVQRSRHRDQRFGLWPSAAYMADGQVTIDASKETITFFSYTVFHRPEPNITDASTALSIELLQFRFDGTMKGCNLETHLLDDEQHVGNLLNQMSISVKPLHGDFGHAYSIEIQYAESGFYYSIFDMGNIGSAGALETGMFDLTFQPLFWNNIVFCSSEGLSCAYTLHQDDEETSVDARHIAVPGADGYMDGAANYPQLVYVGDRVYPRGVNDSFLLTSARDRLIVYHFDNFGTSYAVKKRKHNPTIVRSLMQRPLGSQPAKKAPSKKASKKMLKKTLRPSSHKMITRSKS